MLFCLSKMFPFMLTSFSIFFFVFHLLKGEAKGWQSHRADDDHNVFRWSKEIFPNPTKDFISCRRIKATTICNPDFLVTSIQATKLDKLISKIANESGCHCSNVYFPEKSGLLIGVALLAHVDWNNTKNREEYMSDFIDYLRKTWKLGKCENDVIIYIEKEFKLKGYTAGANVSNLVEDQIFRQIFSNETENLLKNGSYYKSLERILTAVYNTIPKETSACNINWDQLVGIAIKVISLGCFSFLVVGFGYKCSMNLRKSRNKTWDVET